MEHYIKFIIGKSIKHWLNTTFFFQHHIALYLKNASHRRDGLLNVEHVLHKWKPVQSRPSLPLPSPSHPGLIPLLGIAKDSTAKCSLTPNLKVQKAEYKINILLCESYWRMSQ